MKGLRKFIYCVVFSFLTLIFLAFIKFAAKDLNKWEFFTVAIIILGYPVSNAVSKLVTAISVKKLKNLIDDSEKEI